MALIALRRLERGEMSQLNLMGVLVPWNLTRILGRFSVFNDGLVVGLCSYTDLQLTQQTENGGTVAPQGPNNSITIQLRSRGNSTLPVVQHSLSAGFGSVVLNTY